VGWNSDLCSEFGNQWVVKDVLTANEVCADCGGGVCDKSSTEVEEE
jgi:transcription initiation factor TFIIIB Brf1 subunit/transcription initiation factor TFIIB